MSTELSTPLHSKGSRARRRGAIAAVLGRRGATTALVLALVFFAYAPQALAAQNLISTPIVSNILDDTATTYQSYVVGFKADSYADMVANNFSSPNSWGSGGLNILHADPLSWRTPYGIGNNQVDLNNGTGGWIGNITASGNEVLVFYDTGHNYPTISTDNFDYTVIHYDGSNWSVLGSAVVDDTTRFASTTPAVEATSVATSTDFVFGAAGYVNPSDWNDSTSLYIRWKQETGAGLRDNGYLLEGGDMTLPITASTTFSLSATTSVQHTGIFQAYAAIQKPLFSVFGLNFGTQTVKAITWQFEVSTSTATEQYQAKTLVETTGLASGFATTTGTTTGVFANTDVSCSFLTGFQFSDCISLLFQPSQNDVSNFYSTLNNGIIYKAPWGYASLFFTELTTGATSTLPSLTFNIADTGLTSAAVVNRTVDLTPWNDLLTGLSILATTGSPKDSKTLREIIEPLWTDFVYLLLFLAVGAEIIGLGGKVISKM